ncbi:MAG: CxxxxCH/CxxCH domain-containing protein [Candidatus Alcyoniella australis]|nr:CxxxxCH/CxxCH domain-containing protein [Candidatus Alcyoniella australis]
MKTDTIHRPKVKAASWWLVIVALIAVLALALLATCTDGDDDDDNDQGELDDCGFALMEVPEGCDSCHGAPPQTSRHPDNIRCYRCHGYVVDQNWEFVDAERHNNGEVDYAVGCSSCHGWNLGTSPPQNLEGSCDVQEQGVGAHAAMRRDAIDAHKVNCVNCHVVPNGTWKPGHIDGDNVAEINFGFMATHDGAQPSYDGETCSNVYCHGATLSGGDHKQPGWWDQSGDASRCGACHRLTDPQGNADADCNSCHPSSVDENQQILPLGSHINGHIDMPGEQ